MASFVPPAQEQFDSERAALRPWIRETPVVQWPGSGADLGGCALKLELFQVTGSFKPRGAFAVMRRLSADQRTQGVAAVSAGNHAMAVAHAARVLGSEAKVFMPSSASPFRVAAARALGAEVVLTADVHAAFAAAEDAVAREGRFFVHPFEGEHIALGTGTLGLEIVSQVPDVEAVVVPIGGGGLCAGVATAMKQARPQCAVFGVEPEGADTMRRSLAAGRPVGIEVVRTIADSLGAPHAAPYSFELCRRVVDDVVTVSDDDLCLAAFELFASAKLAVEPAGAAATAAALGPLRERLAGRRAVLIVCGGNIDPAGFTRHLGRGERLRAGGGSPA